MSTELATTHPAPGTAPAPGGIGATRARLLSRETTVTEHVAATLDRIRTHDHELGAYLSVAGDEVLREAEAADARIRALGAAAWEAQPLLGITVSVKDLIQTEDLPTTRGSLLKNPRRRIDAPAVARLRAAGAVVVGKTTTSEYGWSASTVSRLAPATRNPWNPALTAGGSSGGAAAAVAAGLCDVSLGTDGAGSIRIPAAFCGVVGFKPSFGQVPYVPSGADRLAHLGPIAADVADAAEVAAVIAGPDSSDPDSGLVSRDAPRRRRSLRIGWVEYPGTTDEVRRISERAWPALAGRGHRLERLPVGCTDLYPVLVDLIAASEAAGTSPADEELCDPGRLAVVRHGRSLSGADVMRAAETRQELRAQLRAVMDGFDLLAMATVPIDPFAAGAIGPEWAADPADLLWIAWAPACFPFNMTGQPAISLPAGLTRAGLPVGVQLVGPFGADSLVLTTALRLEDDLGRLPAPPSGAHRSAIPSPERTS